MRQCKYQNTLTSNKALLRYPQLQKRRVNVTNIKRKAFPFRMPVRIHQLLTLKAIQENKHINDVILNAVEKDLKNFKFKLDSK